MGDWNLGSVASAIHNRLDNIPTLYSGTEMLDAIDERRIYMENELNLTIGSTSIVKKYQGPLIKFAMSDTLTIIETQGTDASSMKIAEFTVQKGGNSSASSSAKIWEEKAEKALVALKPRYSFSRTF